MDVNKIKILDTDLTKGIVVPIGMNWDFLDRESSILDEQQNIVDQVIGQPINYELSRFSHDATGQGFSRLTYRFNFASTIEGPWENSYLSKFTDTQVRYATDAFNKSFFKLDFYSSMDPKTQKNYLTVILPTRMSTSILESTCTEYFFTFLMDGKLTYTDCCNNEKILNVIPGIPGLSPTRRICVKLGTQAVFSYLDLDRDGLLYIRYFITVDFPNGSGGKFAISEIGPCSCDTGLPSTESTSRPLVTPTILLDHTGNKEGFYLHWFEDVTVTNITTFYMTAKFFNAATGQYIKFINEPQTSYSNLYRIPNKDFYYIVNLDYNAKTYQIISTQTDNATDEITWAEYINPPIG